MRDLVETDWGFYTVLDLADDELDKGPAMEADTGAAGFPAWWRILNKATDPVASRRYQSAKALVKELKMAMRSPERRVPCTGEDMLGCLRT